MKKNQTLFYGIAFVLSLCFGLCFCTNSSASALSKSVTLTKDTDFCTIDGHTSDCSHINVYNSKGYFDNFLDFSPKYFTISSDIDYFYDSSFLIVQCQVFSSTNISNCYGVISNYIPGTIAYSLENISSNFGSAFVLRIVKSALISGKTYTFTFYDEIPEGCPECEECQECETCPPSTGGGGDYSGVIRAIYICGASVVVCMFFYLILKMFMGVRR